MKAILSMALVLGACGLVAAAEDKVADPVGTWQCSYEIGEQKRTSTLTVKKEGAKLVGTMSWPDQKDEKIKDPKFKDGKLTFSAVRKFMGQFRENTLGGIRVFCSYCFPVTSDWRAIARGGMMEILTEKVIASFKDAARKLTGPKRRAFEAQVTLDYLDGNIWKAEKVFGWSHHTVALGLNELRTGITCLDHFSARGNRKTEAKFPELEADIRALAEPESQADPKFQSPFLYTRMTAKAVRKALIDQKGWTDEELPHVNTIGEILNRLGIKLRPVQKAKPLKKIKETEAIFATVRQENQAADDDPDVIRISMDAKAKVSVGATPEAG